jgi:hypothetical protein
VADLHLANLLVGPGDRLPVVDTGSATTRGGTPWRELRRLFAPGDVVEAARLADRGLALS